MAYLINKIRLEICLMDEKQIKFLHTEIVRYNSYSHSKEKENLRNEIYLTMLPFIKKWISSILAKKSIFWDQEEMLSKSCDCFEFCLKHFKPEKKIAIPNHFYSYTNFYLKIHDKINNQKISEQEFEVKNSYLGNEDLYNQLDELKSFRNILSTEYALVFDDALMSLIPNNKDKQYRIKQSNLSSIRYQESKKIFKIVIDYLLRR
jgi:hypothetical protein